MLCVFDKPLVGADNVCLRAHLKTGVSMPYRIRGTNVEHMVGGKWKVKQHCGSKPDAEAALRLLNGIDHDPGFEKKVMARQRQGR